MNLRQTSIALGIFIAIFMGIGFNIQNSVYSESLHNNLTDITDNNSNNNNIKRIEQESLPRTSLDENFDNLDELFSVKLDNYSSLSYFPQIYQSSLHATYYALYALNAISKLDTVNQTAITNYIMDNYNDSTHIFMDKYAYRYLDTDFSQEYYPYTSILEVNCYAILSLDILGNLYLINKQEFIDFIWSCYNPITSGFIGQQYSTDLCKYFNISTMDNTYYAIITLDLLMDDWFGYETEKNSLINYINGLQSTNLWEAAYGGFYNSEEIGFDSLGNEFEPNLLSSYYCLKSLDVFDLVDTIRIPDFHSYLSVLYNDQNDFFQFSYFAQPENFTDIIATALGLELSDLTGYTGINRNNVLSFILDNRNEMGNWDNSRQYQYHELIDTFQIIRVLKETGEISQLIDDEKTEIANAINDNYFHYDGFSLLSRDYVSMELIFTIVSSFDLYDRISELDLQGLYDDIVASCRYNGLFDYYIFYATTNLEEDVTRFRSNPIEYYCDGYHNYTNFIDTLNDHKSNFMALSALEKIYKLDDFEVGHNLTKIMEAIIDSQFLEEGFDNFGAFLPNPSALFLSPELQNKEIFFEYSYYAIKSLELLSAYLDKGAVKDLDFDKTALYTYINKNIKELPDDTLYFDPQYSNNLETILQNTYYMIYVLKAIDLYTLDDQKIKNFVEQNIDYSNIKNIYYSWKISKILNLNISFNVEQTHNLVQEVYSEELHEYYLTTQKKVIDQEIFLWICDMAKNDDIRINSVVDDVVWLGSETTIQASICNAILEDFGPYSIVKFESDQLGTFNLDKQENNIFNKSIFVSVDSGNYPIIEGKICVYNGPIKVAEKFISFNTTFELDYITKETKHLKNIDLEVNISFISGTGPQPLYESEIYAKIYRDGGYVENKLFDSNHLLEKTIFTLSFAPSGPSGNYSLEVYLLDGYYPEGLPLFDSWIYIESEDSSGDDDGDGGGSGGGDGGGSGGSNDKDNTEVKVDTNTMLNAIPIMLAITSVPISAIIVSSKVRHKLKIRSKNT